jgi:hypothetical protein
MQRRRMEWMACSDRVVSRSRRALKVVVDVVGAELLELATAYERDHVGAGQALVVVDRLV